MRQLDRASISKGNAAARGTLQYYFKCVTAYPNSQQSTANSQQSTVNSQQSTLIPVQPELISITN